MSENTKVADIPEEEIKDTVEKDVEKAKKPSAKELQEENEKLKAELEQLQQERNKEIEERDSREAANSKLSNMEKKVKIKLFKDNDKYKDDVIVGLNGTMWRIPRGIEVEIPLAIKEILDNSEKQNQAACNFQAQLVSEYEEKSKEN